MDRGYSVSKDDKHATAIAISAADRQRGMQEVEGLRDRLVGTNR